jgi:multiple sugar transport system substrate-binding protein
MAIDRDQPTPLYFQLKNLLLEEIRAGLYALDGRLPTEHELCALHQLSRAPVTRALSELAREGVVVRTRRRGTFVNPDWLHTQADVPVLQAVVPPGPWGPLLQEAEGGDARIAITTVQGPSLYKAPSTYDTLRRAVAEGRGPDIALLDAVWAPEFAAAGFLHAVEELDPSWAGEVAEDLLPALRRADRFQGQAFGVSPFGDVAGLWCRLVLVGASPPSTWAELRAAARNLVAIGRRHPIALPGGRTGAETTAYCLLAALASNGVEVLHDGQVTLGVPATRAVLRFLLGLVDDGLVAEDAVGFEADHAIELLCDGRASFSLGGSYQAPVLAAALDVPLVELSDHLAFVPIPAGPAGAPATLVGTSLFAVFRQSAHPQLALRVLDRALAPDRLARVAAATGRIPARRSAVALAAPMLPFVAETAAMLDGAVTRPSTAVYPRVSLQLQEMLEAVLTRRLGPAAAARRAAQDVAAITGLPLYAPSRNGMTAADSAGSTLMS